MDTSQLHVWAIVRLLPNLQRIVVNRFRRRGEAENYLQILRCSIYDTNLVIVFDPPSKAITSATHVNRPDKSISSSSRIAARD